MLSLEQVIDQLGSSDQVKAYQARQALHQRCAEAGAAGREAQRRELAAALAAAIQATRPSSDPKKPAEQTPLRSASVRGQLARALASVGGEPEVPALRAALKDFDVREMARWALDRMTCQGATDALVEAATQGVGVEFRVGAINALGKRNGSSVTAALRQCAADADYDVRLAAIEALANHPDPAHDEVISGVSPAGPSGSGKRVGKRVARARIRLADKLARAGQKDAARKIFQAVAESKADDAQKKAARVAIAELG